MSLDSTPGLSLQGKVITLQAPLGTETGSFTASLEISLQDYPSISSVKYEFSYKINPYIPSEEQNIPSVSFPPYFEPALPDQFTIGLNEVWTYSMPSALDGEGEPLEDFSIDI